jgi:hypothetical protein
MVTVGIVDRCWVLAPVMLVDLATTFGVVAYIMRLLPTMARHPAQRRDETTAGPHRPQR